MQLDLLSVAVRSAGKTRCEPEWRWDHHHRNYDYLVLLAVTGGRGRIRSPAQTHALRAGDCYLLRMWNPYTGESDPDDPMSMAWAWLRFMGGDGRPIPLVELPDDALPAPHRRLADPFFFEALFDRALGVYRDRGAGDARTRHWFASVLLEAGRQERLPQPSGPEREQRDRMRAIAARIREEPGRPWRVGELARETGYSPEHFARLFRQHSIETPYARKQRKRQRAAAGPRVRPH